MADLFGVLHWSNLVNLAKIMEVAKFEFIPIYCVYKF